MLCSLESLGNLSYVDPRRLGMMVWQDFVQMFAPPATNDTTEAQFELEAMRVVTVRLAWFASCPGQSKNA